MNLTRMRFLFLSFAILAPTVYAVEQLPEKEEDIPVEFVPTLDTAVSVGLHRLNSGPKVRFGNLGSIGLPSTDDSDHPTQKTYSNGSVTEDYLSAYEANYSKDSGQWVQMMNNGDKRSSIGWVSQVQVVNGPSGTERYVTIYRPVASALLDSNGKPVTFLYNGSTAYLPDSTSLVTQNPDGSTSVSDTTKSVWASTARMLGYDASRTRTWSVQSASQIDKTNHTVTMDSYGASSMGESKKAEAGASTGFEVSIEKTLRHYGRLEVGMSAGLQLQQINAKSAGTVWAHLVDRRDVYSMVKTAGNSAMYDNWTVADPSVASDGTVTYLNYTDALTAGPSQSIKLVGLDGSQVYAYAGMTTTPSTYAGSADASIIIPLNVTNVNRTLYDGGTQDTTISETGQTLHHGGYLGEILVHGFWQLKGAYYLMNFGPNFRYRFNDRWAISGKVALSVAYIGVVFRADEHFSDGYDDGSSDVYLYKTGAFTSLVDDPVNGKTYKIQEQNQTHRFLGGVYGEINAEYWLTERTGFYAGATLQTLRSFSATPLSGRTATVDLGDNAGWHVGIITRF